MKKTIKDGVGILIAFVVFWSAGVLLLPVVAFFWPIDVNRDLFALKPQHLPTITVGFLLALYTFRRFTKAPIAHSNHPLNRAP